MSAGDAMSGHNRPTIAVLRRDLRDLKELAEVHSTEELSGIIIGLRLATGEYGRTGIPLVVSKYFQILAEVRDGTYDPDEYGLDDEEEDY